MFKNFTPPTTCGKCKFLGRYDEDYKVKEDTLDKNCPLKDLDGGNK